MVVVVIRIIIMIIIVRIVTIDYHFIGLYCYIPSIRYPKISILIGLPTMDWDSLLDGWETHFVAPTGSPLNRECIGNVDTPSSLVPS